LVHSDEVRRVVPEFDEKELASLITIVREEDDDDD
jgi:hypothetical protein